MQQDASETPILALGQDNLQTTPRSAVSTGQRQGQGASMPGRPTSLAGVLCRASSLLTRRDPASRSASSCRAQDQI